jgi:hypothetical protein
MRYGWQKGLCREDARGCTRAFKRSTIALRRTRSATSAELWARSTPPSLKRVPLRCDVPRKNAAAAATVQGRTDAGADGGLLVRSAMWAVHDPRRRGAIRHTGLKRQTPAAKPPSQCARGKAVPAPTPRSQPSLGSEWMGQALCCSRRCARTMTTGAAAARRMGKDQRPASRATRSLSPCFMSTCVKHPPHACSQPPLPHEYMRRPSASGSSSSPGAGGGTV